MQHIAVCEPLHCACFEPCAVIVGAVAAVGIHIKAAVGPAHELSVGTGYEIGIKVDIDHFFFGMSSDSYLAVKGHGLHCAALYDEQLRSEKPFGIKHCI